MLPTIQSEHQADEASNLGYDEANNNPLPPYPIGEAKNLKSNEPPVGYTFHSPPPMLQTQEEDPQLTIMSNFMKLLVYANAAGYWYSNTESSQTTSLTLHNPFDTEPLSMSLEITKSSSSEDPAGSFNRSFLNGATIEVTYELSSNGISASINIPLGGPPSSPGYMPDIRKCLDEIYSIYTTWVDSLTSHSENPLTPEQIALISTNGAILIQMLDSLPLEDLDSPQINDRQKMFLTQFREVVATTKQNIQSVVDNYS